MPASATFLSLPAADLQALGDARVVVIGASEGTPYDKGVRSHSADAPAELRRASQQFAKSLRQHDFDLGATLFPEKDAWRGCVDAGDVPTNPWGADGNRARIRDGVAAIVAAGAVPILLGGDDSVPIPALAGMGQAGPLTILQIDAHVDWGDAIRGEPLGYGSTMRRVSEYPWVEAMVQVGIRGLGSGEGWQHDDARQWGARLVTSYDLHERGPAAALDHVAEGANVFVAIDCDGLDPAVLPAVAMPTPGGLGYEDVVRLLRGVAAKGRIAGLALAEYVPARDDRHQLSGLAAARIAAVTIGLALGAG